jgi:hypothetical protein
VVDLCLEPGFANKRVNVLERLVRRPVASFVIVVRPFEFTTTCSIICQEDWYMFNEIRVDSMFIGM